MDKLHFRTIAVLPAVYSDALSYYEVLAKVSAKLNEVIDALNVYDPDAEVDKLITARLEEYTVNTLNPAISSAIDDAVAPINRYIESILSAIGIINGKIDRQQELIDALTTGLVNAVTECKEYTDAAISEAEFAALPEVLSPFTGLMTSIPDLMYEITDYIRDCYTAAEFDAFELTAAGVDALDATATEIDFTKTWIA